MLATLVDSNVILDVATEDPEWMDWSPLPDFYIGAHAAVEGLTLLTRDPARYRTYFPRVRILSP